ncbi:hypothetical protein AB4Z40_07030 [Bosea sp. 2YAB26]|uniref:hypothetical protein n=1 Tax=unclassified Bosea (in: a-proteobacteria) TaxID=2653178 RepID=UPI003F8F4630
MRRALLKTTLVAATCLAATISVEATSRRYVDPADRAEARIIPMYGNLPACEDPAVLSEITSWFNSREAKFWGPLQAVAYDRIRPIGFRPWGDDFIPRRFCTGRIALNDGSLHRIDYSVRENLGLFGLTWNVNWCVNGLDRGLSYAPNCQMARPGPEK